MNHAKCLNKTTEEIIIYHIVYYLYYYLDIDMCTKFMFCTCIIHLAGVRRYIWIRERLPLRSTWFHFPCILHNMCMGCPSRYMSIVLYLFILKDHPFRYDCQYFYYSKLENSSMWSATGWRLHCVKYAFKTFLRSTNFHSEFIYSEIVGLS